MRKKLLVCTVQDFDLEFIAQLPKPFATLVDADDATYSDSVLRNDVVNSLLTAGCSYFVCAGNKAEQLHDQIDDLIVLRGLLEVVTTFHHDESEDEIAEFILNCTGNIPGVLALVPELSAYGRAIRRVLAS